MPSNPESVRIAAVADIHCQRIPPDELRPMLLQANEQADVLLLCGDLTDLGTSEEALVLAKELSVARLPMVGVLGNHDFQSGRPDEVREILIDAGVRMLDGEVCEFHGVGFAGVKGFAGGFGRRTLEPWGESIIKQFVQEALDETLKLESALARLRPKHRIAVLHYAPIRATVVGEPEEIFAFLGSSRLEEPINRYGVTAVFHGHAHRGAPEGKTQTGIPVFNVSMSLLKKTYPDRPSFRLFEVPRERPEGEQASGIA